MILIKIIIALAFCDISSFYVESLPADNYDIISVSSFDMAKNKDISEEQLQKVAPHIGKFRLLGKERIDGISAVIDTVVSASEPFDPAKGKPAEKNKRGKLSYAIGDSLSSQYYEACKSKTKYNFRKRIIHSAKSERNRDIFSHLFNDSLIIQASSLELVKKAILALDGEGESIVSTEQYKLVKEYYNQQEAFSIDLRNFHQANYYKEKEHQQAISAYERRALYKVSTFDLSSEGLFMEEIYVYSDKDYVPETMAIDFSKLNWNNAPKSLRNQVMAYGKDWREKKDGARMIRTKMVPYEILLKGNKVRKDLRKWKEEMKQRKEKENEEKNK